MRATSLAQGADEADWTLLFTESLWILGVDPIPVDAHFTPQRDHAKTRIVLDRSLGAALMRLYTSESFGPHDRATLHACAHEAEQGTGVAGSAPFVSYDTRWQAAAGVRYYVDLDWVRSVSVDEAGAHARILLEIWGR